MCARNKPPLQQAAEKIQQQYEVPVLAEAFDVTDAGAVHDFVNSVVARFGAADICVTNAGGPPAKGFLATNHDDWRKALDQNFLSTVYFAHEVIPHMQAKRWGRIITITSHNHQATSAGPGLVECGAGRGGWPGQEFGQRVRQGRHSGE